MAEDSGQYRIGNVCLVLSGKGGVGKMLLKHFNRL